MQHLRFSAAEAADSAALHFVVHKTEGWPVGLRLATLSMAGTAHVDEVALHLGNSSSGLVVDYFVAEVLEHATLGMREFMLKMSICDRLCAGLCTALLDDPASESTVEELAQALMRTHLFVVELDDERNWWRYHHLFQELLQHQLRHRSSAAELQRLHTRAARWYAEHGYLDEALEHMLATDDMEAAVELIERHRYTLMNADRWHVLERWLAKLPEAVKRSHPALLLAQAWSVHYRLANGTLPGLMGEIRRLWSGQTPAPSLQAEVHYCEGLVRFWTGDSGGAIDALAEALRGFAEEAIQLRGEAVLYNALAHYTRGQKRASVQTVTQNLYSSETISDLYKTRLIGTLVFLHMLAGESEEAKGQAYRLLALGKKIKSVHVQAWANYLLGHCAYGENRLDAALPHFQAAVADRYVLHRPAAIDSCVGLALTQAALNEATPADDALALLDDFAAESGQLVFVRIARATRARLELRRGKFRPAPEQFDIVGPDASDMLLFFWLEIPQTTVCRLYVAQDDRASICAGLARLEELRTAAWQEHNVRQLLEIEILRAAGYQSLGRHEQARVTLDHALDLAAPGGWIRPFVEASAELADLLRGLTPRHPRHEFVHQLLAAIPSPVGCVGEAHGQQRPELLTSRETEVLVLLAQRMSNQEIASELMISLPTVKRHAANIYQKLQVSNRRSAVAKVRAIGKLPPPINHPVPSPVADLHLFCIFW